MIHQAKETFHVAGNGDTFTAKQNTWTIADMLLHAAPILSPDLGLWPCPLLHFPDISRNGSASKPHHKFWLTPAWIVAGFHCTPVDSAGHPWMHTNVKGILNLLPNCNYRQPHKNLGTQKVNRDWKKNLKKLTTTIRRVLVVDALSQWLPSSGHRHADGLAESHTSTVLPPLDSAFPNRIRLKSCEITIVSKLVRRN